MVDDTKKAYLTDLMIGSVHDVFLTFLAMEVFPGPATDEVGKNPDERPPTEMTVMVGFGGTFSGGLCLSSPLPVALALARSLTGRMVATMCTNETKEALAHLAHKIACSVQSRVSQQGHGEKFIYLTPPAVVFGHDCDLSYGKHASSLKQTFQVDAGPFFVECFYLEC